MNRISEEPTTTAVGCVIDADSAINHRWQSRVGSADQLSRSTNRNNPDRKEVGQWNAGATTS
jgi:hypothetical protein